MIDLDLHWELCWEEHVQPGYHIGDLEYDKSECSAEETLEKVAHNVICA